MKNLYKILSFLIFSLLIYGSCSPDDYSLGEVDVKSEDLVEGIAYKIEHDASNPNIVYLTSLMDSKFTPLWNHPQGRSQENAVTLKIPFAGTYDVQFGVQTRGGYVYGDTTTFVVDDLYAGFIEDELWTFISGGSGGSKTWYLDLDADGASHYFLGPMYFFRNWYTWDGLHNSSGGNYLDDDVWEWKSAILPTLERDGDKNSGTPQENTQAWYWLADWPSNSWMCDAADFGTMTFNLIGGANLTVDQEAYGLGNNTGSFMLDVENHTIKFTDVRPLHDLNRDAEDVDWYNCRILYVNDDAMQIAVVPYGDAASMVVYNYISKDYLDNWVPEDLPDPEPILPDGWQDDVSKTVSYAIKWVLSPETPFNWANLDGSLKNTVWVSPDTYDDWTGFDATIPETYSNFSLTINSQDNSVAMVLPDGTESSGTYELDEKGIYTFNGVKPEFNICSWVNLSTTAENQWRILSIEKDPAGNVSGMWVGALSTEKPEYMCYKLIPQSVGSGDNAPQGTELAFDNSKLVFGDLEDNGNLRLELYNDYGTTATDPPLNRDDLVVDNRIEITFTLSGITLSDGATGSYDTALSLADGDWSPQYWGDGSQEEVVAVTGDGTYKVWYDPTSTSEGAAVFVIDIKGMATDIADLTAVTAKIDKIIMY